jgi:hypothetical protein
MWWSHCHCIGCWPCQHIMWWSHCHCVYRLLALSTHYVVVTLPLYRLLALSTHYVVVTLPLYRLLALSTHYVVVTLYRLLALSTHYVVVTLPLRPSSPTTAGNTNQRWGSNHEPVANDVNTATSFIRIARRWGWVRWGCERAGATFVKFGQWAAMRRDMFPTRMCDALDGLTDSATPHSWEDTEVGLTILMFFTHALTRFFFACAYVCC